MDLSNIIGTITVIVGIVDIIVRAIEITIALHQKPR
jgi:hypothetical protein